MAISDEIKEQTVKLKDMTTKEKIDYIYTYYKWWFIIGIFLIIVITSVAKAMISNSKPVYLGAVFLNSKIAGSPVECTLEDEFVQAVGINRNEYNLSMDYVTFLDDDYGNQASYAGQVKLMSMYSAEELDIVCGQESVLKGPGDVGGYQNLSEVFTKEKLDELEKKGYEIFYYTEKVYADDAVPDENGVTPYTDGETYPAGIYIDNCAMLVGDKSSCVYDKGMEDRPVLTIAWNTTNLENAVEFINFVTQ